MYMIMEAFTAIGMYAFAGILSAVMIAIKNREKARQYMTIIIIAILILATGTLWHSMSWRHADNIQKILREAYKHPALWNANP